MHARAARRASQADANQADSPGGGPALVIALCGVAIFTLLVAIPTLLSDAESPAAPDAVVTARVAPAVEDRTLSVSAPTSAAINSDESQTDLAAPGVYQYGGDFLTASLRDVIERVRDGEDDALAQRLVDVLTELAAESAAGRQSLISMLRNPEEDPALRRALAVALGRLEDTDVTAALLAVLGDGADRHEVRTVAMLALNTDRSGLVDQTPPQISIRTTEGFPISLGRNSDPAVVNALARSLMPDWGNELVFIALKAVGESLEDPLLASAVVEVAFRGQTLDHRLEAIERLNQTHAGEYGFMALRHLSMNASQLDVWMTATHALGSYPYPGVVATLGLRLDDPYENERVRTASLGALERVMASLSHSEAVSAIQLLSRTASSSNGPLRQAARDALARLASDSDVSDAVRMSAHAALGGLKSGPNE